MMNLNHAKMVRKVMANFSGADRAFALNVLNSLDELTEEQRLSLFTCYCRQCGSLDPECVCWRDE